MSSEAKNIFLGTLFGCLFIFFVVYYIMKKFKSGDWSLSDSNSDSEGVISKRTDINWNEAKNIRKVKGGY